METIVQELIAEHETTIQAYRDALARLASQPDNFNTRAAFWNAVKEYRQQMSNHQIARDALREALRRATAPPRVAVAVAVAAVAALA